MAQRAPVPRNESIPESRNNPRNSSTCSIPSPSRLGSSTTGSPIITNTARNRLLHAAHPYGNYHNYYSHRTDSRLALLPPSLFAGKRVLDLGCNAGNISLEIKGLGARAVLGIDIDEVLIQQARALSVETAGGQPNGGGEGVAGVEFIQGDFMQPNYFHSLFDFPTPDLVSAIKSDATPPNATRRERPETILLLSITKWLHLHHHDAGLLLLFRTLYSLLPSGGTLIIEPQEWANYARATKKNKELREVYKGLRMRPDFVLELEGVGFRCVGRIERVEGGFSRPLYQWRKD